jgi:hypothetical protein
MVELVDKNPRIMIFIGSSVDGFNGFLSENCLDTIDPDTLNEYITRGIIYFEKKDLESTKLLMKEILDLVRVMDKETAEMVIIEFGRLCETYRSIIDTIKWN